jgi:hypothetical protein
MFNILLKSVSAAVCFISFVLLADQELTVKGNVNASNTQISLDLYFYPDESSLHQFLSNFLAAIMSFDDRIFFTPHYNIIDGIASGCRIPGQECNEASLSCGSQCSNCGRYCRISPSGDLSKRPFGMDIVIEAAVSKCIWEYSMNQTIPIISLWWNYEYIRLNTLGCDNQTLYDPNCINKAMSLSGMNQQLIDSIYDCAGDIVFLDDNENPLLEYELLWQRKWQPHSIPSFYVNSTLYTGSFNCSAPLRPSTCGVLDMICNSFEYSFTYQNGIEPMPEICRSLDENNKELISLY